MEMTGQKNKLKNKRWDIVHHTPRHTPRAGDFDDILPWRVPPRLVDDNDDSDSGHNSGRDPENPDRDDRRQTGLLLKPRPKTRKPNMYRVLLLNDDYTPMEFVVHILERFFNKNRQEATDIMLHVHRRGVGICGVFTYEIAETKMAQVMDFARANEQPLQCTMEKE